MAIRARIEPLDRDIAVMLSEDLSPEAQSKALANFARAELQDAQTVNRQVLGRVPSHDTFVDGRSTEALDTVRPNGVIVFEFELLDEMFGWIDLQLITHSPVRSGRYRRSHKLFADGAEVDPDQALPAATEYVYLNTQVYSRKIEQGISKQAPDGVYQAVALLARRRFGNMAKIAFSYRAVAGSKERQPAIIATVR